MKFAQNNHPTRLCGPTRLFCPTHLFGTWEYPSTQMTIIFAQNDSILKSVISVWVNFIEKSGLPDVIGDPDWPEYWDACLEAASALSPSQWTVEAYEAQWIYIFFDFTAIF